MKSRLILIAIMFIVINLIFYFGFDSPKDSENSVDIDDQNQMNSKENSDLVPKITNPINP